MACVKIELEKSHRQKTSVVVGTFATFFLLAISAWKTFFFLWETARSANSRNWQPETLATTKASYLERMITMYLKPFSPFTSHFLTQKVDQYKYQPRKSKDQILPLGSRESLTWIIQKTILCLVLDFQGQYIIWSTPLTHKVRRSIYQHNININILYMINTFFEKTIPTQSYLLQIRFLQLRHLQGQLFCLRTMSRSWGLDPKLGRESQPSLCWIGKTWDSTIHLWFVVFCEDFHFWKGDVS